MKKVYFFEEKCCGVSVAEPLANFLRSELAGEADVRVFDLSHPDGLTPLPPSLFFKLMSDGSKSLPAMTVDSSVITQGWLPDRAKALEIVVSGVSVEVDAVAAGGACQCAPGKCC